MVSFFLSLLIALTVGRGTTAAPLPAARYVTLSTNEPGVSQRVYTGSGRLPSARTFDLPLTATSALVMDKKTGMVLFDKNADRVRPIASLTKLLTALVFLEQKPDWNKTIIYSHDYDAGGANLSLGLGEEVRLDDVFTTMLVGSRNNAARMVATSTGLSEKQFVALMNQKARVLGLPSMFFSEPTGLSADDRSSARDYARVLELALQQPAIAAAMTLPSFTLEVQNFNQRKILVKNTDLLLKTNLIVRGAKTGYTEEAGYCLASDIANSDGQEVYVIVLGVPDSDTRFQEAQALSQWAFESYKF